MEIRRTFNLDESNFRWADEESRAAKAGDFYGHAAVFNEATIIGERGFGFVEIVARSAFDNVLDNDVRLLVNHDGLPLARTTNGTLTLTIDNKGLRNDAQIAPTSMGRDVATLLARGDVNEQSFAFTVRSDSWFDLEDNQYDEPFKNDGPITQGSDQLDEYERNSRNAAVFAQAREWGITDLRVIRSLDRLYDVSVVTYPAYSGAKAGVRFGRAPLTEIESLLKNVRSGREVSKAKLDLVKERQALLAKRMV